MEQCAGEQYYIERLARQWRNRIIPIPDGVSFEKITRFRLTEEEFRAAFLDYQENLRQIYRNIAASPGDFGMVALPIEPMAGPVTQNERKSIRSFERLAKTMCALAEEGSFASDGGITIPADRLKARGIVKVGKIFTGLSQSGFSVKRMKSVGQASSVRQTGASDQPDEVYCLNHMKNPAIFRVMKALAEAKIGEAIVTADYRYLFCEKAKIVFTAEDIVRLIADESGRALVRSIVALHGNRGYSIKVEFQYNPARIRISSKPYRREMVSIRVERDDSLWIGVRLSVGTLQKEGLLDTLSPHILSQTLSGRDCIDCGGCKEGGVTFSYKGQTYRKCSTMFANFIYSPKTEEDGASVLRLIEANLRENS